MQKEAKARIKINRLLEQSGWRLPDHEHPTVAVEEGVDITRLGDDFEGAGKGFVDYTLLDDRGFPLCVLEAKSEDKDPLIGKEQARDYANGLNVRFVILSNGNIHYFWDKELGNPTRISSFPKAENLQGQKQFTPDSARLTSEQVSNDYVALTQNPHYSQDPRWVDESQRPIFIGDTGLRFLRPYQLTAVQTLQRAVSQSKNRFLFEMATGTGKTLLAAAIIKLYLRTGNARRVLFLVDRLELENQALKAFHDYLKPDYETVIFKESKDEWRRAEVVVTTIQSISHNNKYLSVFNPTDFDLIISDEAHRSLSGNSRAIFEYFIGHKLGLTATPKDYLKNLNLVETDPRELEKRVLLSTYKTFGCESGEPTFRYSLEDGVRDKYLVPPSAIDCRTEITTKLLSEEGYAVQVQSDEGEEEEVIYHQTDFERKYFNDPTNRQFAKTFLENALTDPITGEIGKSIIFCVSRRHAAKMANALNELAMQMFPGKYQSDFAMQVTSDVPDAQQMTINFANNNLRGTTQFLQGYKSSKARVCCTVGMMTTGYDCQDLLNVCLMRPIFSPTDFVQIKGRGTRKYTFTYRRDDERRDEQKASFRLFDFFANCQYFDEEFPYSDVIELPREGTGPTPPPPPPPPPPDHTTTDIPDPLKIMEVFKSDGGIMRVDRELYASRFEQTVKSTAEQFPELKEAIDSSDYERAEAFIKEHIFNKPEDYFTLDAIRKAYHADRRLGLWEILDKIFGRIQAFKTKDQLAQEEFEQYLVADSLPPDLYYEAREFFKRYLIDQGFRLAVDQRHFNEFAGDPDTMAVLHRLAPEWIEQIPAYIKDNVHLNKFTD